MICDEIKQSNELEQQDEQLPSGKKCRISCNYTLEHLRDIACEYCGLHI